MSTILPFTNNTIPVYVYEGFSYTISNPSVINPYTVVVSNSGGLPSGYFSSNASSVTFSTTAPSNILTAGTTESFTIRVTDACGTIYTSSNSVPIGAGRFLDASGNSALNNRYTFYSQEPITKVRLVAPFNLASNVTTVPTLPPGLSFYVTGSNADLSGTPLTTLSSSNYLIIGTQSNGGKIVTTSNTIAVSNSRILYNLSGSPIINNMIVGGQIDSRTITAQFPPYPSGGVLKYTWPALPDGIRVYDYAGNDVTASNLIGVNTFDASHALTIAGAPTSNAAYAFAAAGNSYNISNAYNIQGLRTSPLPAITSNLPLTFSFAETILFDLSTIPTIYTGVPVDPSANFFHATTYFATGLGSNISNIYSPDLRSDLSLVFVPGAGRANLSGTPILGASTDSFIIRATNSNGVVRDYITPITVRDDVVVFSVTTPATDTCYNFILSRPSELAKAGYYPSNIQFSATAASGLPVTLTAAALNGTGLNFVGGNISGTPTAITPITTLSVVATVTGSPATATRNVKFAILNDAFTFGSLPSGTWNFYQNIAITPFQIPVTTLSERPVIDFSQHGLPTGLKISPAGVVSGTPTSNGSGTAEIIPTTGYASGSEMVPYNVAVDKIVMFAPQEDYFFAPGDSASIQITAQSFSGARATNFTFINTIFDQVHGTKDVSTNTLFGLTIDSSSGLITGPWTNGIPPNPTLPVLSNFSVLSLTGNVGKQLSARIETNPTIVNAQLVLVNYGGTNGGIYWSSDYKTWNYIDTSYLIESEAYSDIQFRGSNPNDARFITTLGDRFVNIGDTLFQVTGVDTNPLTYITTVDVNPVWGSVTNKTGTTRWWVSGYTDNGTFIVGQSWDDGFNWDNVDLLEPIRVGGTQPMYTRGYGMDPPQKNRAYLWGGSALRYSDGVLMAGGYGGTDYENRVAMARSTDDGVTWAKVGGDFGSEVARYCLDVSGMWICTGSSYYRTLASNVYDGTTADTIRYSADKGANWGNVTGAFNMFAYDVVYAAGTWLATGIHYDTGTSRYRTQLRYSTNGVNWALVDLGYTPQNENDGIGFSSTPPLSISGLSFDGTYWNVTVCDEGTYTWNLTHDATSSLASGWIPRTDTTLPWDYNNGSYGYIVTMPHVLRTNYGDISGRLKFGSGTGPAFIQPATTNFLFYLYLAIDPIQFSANLGGGPVYFFVLDEQIPPGLAFDPILKQITGIPAEVGSYKVTVYAQNNNGVSSLTITLNILATPRVLRKQDGAGAYTSLLRQYTEVLGAQNARDNRALPNQDRALGEFMSPDAPDVVTQTIDPKCRNPAC